MCRTYSNMHAAMIKNGKLQYIFAEAFPMEPLPLRFFWAEGKFSPDGEIPSELKKRILGRRWKEVTLMDWRMVGLPAVSRLYLDPAAFVYYVPSIILGVYPELDFIELALEAMIPFNKGHVPRGRWWFEFVSVVSPSQRKAFSAFLEDIRLTAWDAIGPENQHYLEVADGIWPRP